MVPSVASFTPAFVDQLLSIDAWLHPKVDQIKRRVGVGFVETSQTDLEPMKAEITVIEQVEAFNCLLNQNEIG